MRRQQPARSAGSGDRMVPACQSPGSQKPASSADGSSPVSSPRRGVADRAGEPGLAYPPGFRATVRTRRGAPAARLFLPAPCLRRPAFRTRFCDADRVVFPATTARFAEASKVLLPGFVVEIFRTTRTAGWLCEPVLLASRLSFRELSRRQPVVRHQRRRAAQCAALPQPARVRLVRC